MHLLEVPMYSTYTIYQNGQFSFIMNFWKADAEFDLTVLWSIEACPLKHTIWNTTPLHSTVL
jgi:hypothetical protein